MRLVRIVWRDSGLQHENGWRMAPQIQNTTPDVESVGYVVHEDNENITIAQGYSADLELYYGIHTIWKTAIVSIDHSLGRKEEAA
jgi:hypothetical protein